MPAVLLIILYITFSILAAYLFAIILFFMCELKMRKMFSAMQSEIRILEKSGISMALKHIRKYKINQDYRRNMERLEKCQQDILKKCLFLKKSTLKTKY